MLASKTTIDETLQSYRSHNRLLCPLPLPYCCLQHLSIYPETNPLWPAIAIDPHNFRHIVGPIAYFEVFYCPGYKNKLNGTQTYRCRTLQAWASHRTCRDSSHRLIVETHPPQTSLRTATTDSAGYGDAPLSWGGTSPRLWSYGRTRVVFATILWKISRQKSRAPWTIVQ